jgi:glycosyltransferase involved in cell wall biosynthesis
MKISIIVPAFNEEKLLRGSLSRILEAGLVFESLGWERELIVCDNNSTDQTAALARAAGAQVVFELVNQIARARNRGAQAASGEWLMFIDADSYPTTKLFAEVARRIKSTRCVAGGATVKLEEFHLAGAILTEVWNLISRTQRWAAGSFLFCEAAAFRQVGGFSTDLYASEEIQLSEQLKALARRQGRQFVILHRTPVVTSGRKLHLNSWGEHLCFLWQFIRQPLLTVRSREACSRWYDGRR